MFSEVLSTCNPDWQVIVSLTVNGILAALASYYAHRARVATTLLQAGGDGGETGDAPRTENKGVQGDEKPQSGS